MKFYSNSYSLSLEIPSYFIWLVLLAFRAALPRATTISSSSDDDDDESSSTISLSTISLNTFVFAFGLAVDLADFAGVFAFPFFAFFAFGFFALGTLRSIQPSSSVGGDVVFDASVELADWDFASRFGKVIITVGLGDVSIWWPRGPSIMYVMVLCLVYTIFG